MQLDSVRRQALKQLARLMMVAVILLLPRIVQAQSGTITGTVTDAATGAPIANIDVIISGFIGEPVATAKSGSTGAYVITGVPPGQYFAAAFPGDGTNYLGEFFDNITCGVGCGLEGMDATILTVAAGGTISNINFSLIKGGIVSGVVTDAANGRGLPNVTVIGAFRLGVDVEIIGSATTDSTGAYTGFPMPEGPVYLYTSNTQGYVNEIYGNVPCVGACSAATALAVGTPVQITYGNTTSGRNFALDLGGSITGTLTNSATGAPIANANVQLNARIGGANVAAGSANTNASGVYSIGGLAAGNYYAFTAVGNAGVMNELYDNILCSVGCTNISSGTEIPVTLGTPTSGRNFALDPGGSITGQVTNQAGGAPLQSVTVTALLRVGTTFFTRTASTNAQGRYTLAGLPTATYWLYTSNSQGFINEIYDNLPCTGACSNTIAAATGAPIAVSVGGTVANRDFALVRGGTISGTIRDAGTGGPLLDNDAFVELYALSGGTRSFVTSTFPSDTGAYSFSGLAAGNYVLMTNGTNEGSPYVNEIYNDIACIGACSAMNVPATPVVVAEGATTPNIDFNLQISGVIVGKVTSAATGLPLAGVTVNVYRRAGTGTFVGSGVTDHGGRYFVISLPNESYVAFTSNTAGYVNEIFNNLPCATTCSAATAVASGTPITVTSVGSSTLKPNFGVDFALDVRNAPPAAPTNFRATASGSTAQFTWTAPTPSTSGVPVSYVIDAGLSPGSTLVSLQAGTGTSFSLPGVPDGRFYLRIRAVNAAGSSTASTEVTLVVNGGLTPPDAPTSVLAFLSGGQLAITWLPATTGGAPASYVVEVGSASGQSNLASVGAAGRSFSYNPVPPGFYFLRVRAVNAGGTSQPSTEVMFVVGGVPSPPGAPNFVSSPVSGNSVTLNWTAPTVGTATSYIVEAGSATGLNNLANHNTGSTSTSLSFSGVPSGTYYVRIRAVNAQGASVVSNERTIVVP